MCGTRALQPHNRGVCWRRVDFIDGVLERWRRENLMCVLPRLHWARCRFRVPACAERETTKPTNRTFLHCEQTQDKMQILASNPKDSTSNQSLLTFISISPSSVFSLPTSTWTTDSAPNRNRLNIATLTMTAPFGLRPRSKKPHHKVFVRSLLADPRLHDCRCSLPALSSLG